MCEISEVVVGHRRNLKVGDKWRHLVFQLLFLLLGRGESLLRVRELGLKLLDV